MSQLVTRGVQRVRAELRNRTRRSVLEFMTSAQIADVQAGTKLQDVTTPLQNAWASGEPLWFPPGAYRMDGTLSSGVVPNMEGAGAQRVELACQATTGTALQFTNAAGSYDPGLTIRGLRITGRGAGNGSTIGMDLQGAVWANSMIENLWVQNMGGAGIVLQDCLTMVGRDVKSQGNGGAGISVRRSNGITLIRPSAESNIGNGIELIDGGGPLAENTGAELVTPHAEENEGHAVYVRNRQFVSILGGWLQVKGTAASTRGAITIDTASRVTAVGSLLTTGGDVTNLAGVLGVGALFSDLLVHCAGFAANRDIVLDAASGRNRFAGTGGGTQGGLSRTDASSTGNVIESWTGSGGNYGREHVAPQHVFRDAAGNERFRITGTVLAFNGSGGSARPTITGSRAGNVALANLLDALQSYGILTNSTV